MPTHLWWALARRSVSKPEEIAYYLADAPLGTDVGRLVPLCRDALGHRGSLPGREERVRAGPERGLPLHRLAAAHCSGHARPRFLATMAADTAAKGDAGTVPSPWLRSPWQKSGGSWQLATHQPSATISR
jgi:hypothetical protein